MDTPIELEIKKVLSKISGIEESRFNENTLIARELGIDSLKAMEIIAEIEMTYNITIEEEKMLNVEKVGEFIELVKGCL